MPMSSSTCTLPGATDAAQVVAAQVDEHHVLGALLLVGAQVVHEPPILGVVGAPPARAGDGPRLDLAALHGHERLGAGADQGEVVEGDEVHIRRRVHGAQAAVDGERRHAHRGAEALARTTWKAVTGVDVVTDALHAGS